MNSFAPLTASASARIVDSPVLVSVRRSGANESHSRTATTSKREGGWSRFLTLLLQSLSTWAA